MLSLGFVSLNDVPYLPALLQLLFAHLEVLLHIFASATMFLMLVSKE